MANRRSLWKKIGLCDQLADVSELACLCYTWAIPHADDWGTIKGSPRVFMATVIPLRKVSPEDVVSALDELVGVGLLVLYEAKGETFLHYPTWEEHQTNLSKRTEKNRHPLPGEGTVFSNFSELQRNSENLREKPMLIPIDNNAPVAPVGAAAPPPIVVVDGPSEKFTEVPPEGKGREEKGREGEVPPAPEPIPSSTPDDIHMRKCNHPVLDAAVRNALRDTSRSNLTDQWFTELLEFVRDYPAITEQSIVDQLATDPPKAGDRYPGPWMRRVFADVLNPQPLAARRGLRPESEWTDTERQIAAHQAKQAQEAARAS